ncbi:translation initiation factor IF-3 [Candidatus Amesbacteria bacterium RIFOXYB1_FULL_44_23]|uniref:Translation initiation factor IF-3 n=1 Tax=Candidatus Amesbacteria bacterium RIFOXYB1_FULL_44_23 TaxID=1797263 RepID=A0A1F4ZYI5_9BACT|nr:MAG: translation initiation factor IF-3 [Candidatus Amesbacteria bacterium RIFOXYB1_FULL_44_23]
MSTFYKINHQIQAKQVRLLREDNTQIGIVPLAEALTQAAAAQVDAVEIAPQAEPPVVKLIDYKKFLYQISKKERASKAAAKKVDIKEIRLTPFMAENDFQVRMTRGRDFLLEGNKLRVSIKFVGRQLTHKEFGPQMMAKTMSSLSEVATMDQDAKWIGRQYMATLTPVKKR